MAAGKGFAVCAFSLAAAGCWLTDFADAVTATGVFALAVALAAEGFLTGATTSDIGCTGLVGAFVSETFSLAIWGFTGLLAAVFLVVIDALTLSLGGAGGLSLLLVIVEP